MSLYKHFTTDDNKFLVLYREYKDTPNLPLDTIWVISKNLPHLIGAYVPELVGVNDDDPVPESVSVVTDHGQPMPTILCRPYVRSDSVEIKTSEYPTTHQGAVFNEHTVKFFYEVRCEERCAKINFLIKPNPIWQPLLMDDTLAILDQIAKHAEEHALDLPYWYSQVHAGYFKQRLKDRNESKCDECLIPLELNSLAGFKIVDGKVLFDLGGSFNREEFVSGWVKPPALDPEIPNSYFNVGGIYESLCHDGKIMAGTWGKLVEEMILDQLHTCRNSRRIYDTEAFSSMYAVPKEVAVWYDQFTAQHRFFDRDHPLFNIGQLIVGLKFNKHNLFDKVDLTEEEVYAAVMAVTKDASRRLIGSILVVTLPEIALVTELTRHLITPGIDFHNWCVQLCDKFSDQIHFGVDTLLPDQIWLNEAIAQAAKVMEGKGHSEASIKDHSYPIPLLFAAKGRPAVMDYLVKVLGTHKYP